MTDSLSVPSASSTRPEHWRYFAEGGTNIVFSYIGTKHNHFTGMVLRLRKRAHAPQLSRTDAPAHPGTPDGGEDVDIAFHQRIISRLVPHEYLPVLQAVAVDRPWLEELALCTESARPTFRREMGGIDFDRTRGVLASDLLGQDGLVVEIKPKWGFLPYPEHLSAQTRAIKTKHCRFCMHAEYKRARGETVAAGFCPLDLYSNNETRMRRALGNLWATWRSSRDQSLHNLRIFIDGQVVQGTDTAAVARVEDWLVSLAQVSTGPADAFAVAVSNCLLDSGVLSTLRGLQKALDPLDIEGLSALASESEELLGGDSVTLEAWSSFAEEHLSAAKAYDYRHPQSAHVRYYHLAYILGASFKDCSVMMGLRLDGAGKVNIIDLDAKSPAKLPGWQALDRAIVESFSNERGRECYDSCV